jgi:hypothetical protein
MTMNTIEKRPAPPMPAMALAAINMLMFFASPHNREPSSNVKIAKRVTDLFVQVNKRDKVEGM